METENQPDEAAVAADAAESNREDLTKLFNYPSIGELFSEADTRQLDDFCVRLTASGENLERIVRYGGRDEAERATRAARAVQVTLDFLQNLQKMRLTQQK